MPFPGLEEYHQSVWAENKGNPPFVNSPMGWELHISVKPTVKNLDKAYKVLQNLSLLAQGKKYPTIKIINLHDAAQNPTEQFATLEEGEDTQTTRHEITQKPDDSEYRGKEICIEIPYDLGQKKFVFSQQELKELMLNLWKALQDAGVELSYTGPAANQKEISSDLGILTPFSYSSTPFNHLSERIRSKAYNSSGYADPLRGLHISVADADDNKITIDNFKTISEARHNEMRTHLVEKKLAVSKQFDAINCQKFDYQKLLEQIKSIENLDKESKKEAAKKLFDKLAKENSELFAMLFEPGNVVKSNYDYFKALCQLKAKADREILKTKAKLEKLKNDQLFYENELFGKALKTLEKRPYAAQTIYALIAEINQEKLACAREGGRCAIIKQFVAANDAPKADGIQKDNNVRQFNNTHKKFPSSYKKLWPEILDQNHQNDLMNLRNMLNDYTKNNSKFGRFFTGHWNRHHVSEVNNIVERIDQLSMSYFEAIQALSKIKLKNTEGSLAHRISFIRESVQDKLAVLIK